MSEVSELRQNYIEAVKAYIKAFEEKQEVSIEFDMFSLANFDIADYCMSLFDIIYDIDANVPAGYIFEYYSKAFDLHLSKKKKKGFENYPHWLNIHKKIKIDFKSYS